MFNKFVPEISILKSKLEFAKTPKMAILGCALGYKPPEIVYVVNCKEELDIETLSILNKDLTDT